MMLLYFNVWVMQKNYLGHVGGAYKFYIIGVM